MAAGNYCASVEMGTSKIICTLAKQQPNDSLQVLGVGVCEYQGMVRGKWAEPSGVLDALTNAVRDCESKARHRVHSVSVGVPGSRMELLRRDVSVSLAGREGNVTHKTVRKLIDAAINITPPSGMQAVAYRPIFFTLSDGSCYLNPVGKRSSQLDGTFSVACADTAYVKDMRYMCSQLGIEAAMFVPENFAQCIHAIAPAERDVGAILLDIGYRETTVSVIFGDAVVGCETVFFGAADVVSAISENFGISYADAECVKRRYSFGLDCEEEDLVDYIHVGGGKLMKFSHRDLQKIIDSRIVYLSEIIYNVVMGRGEMLSALSKIYLVGSGVSEMQGVRAFLQSSIGIPVAVCNSRTAAISQGYTATSLALVESDLYSDFCIRANGGLPRTKRFSGRKK